MTSEWKFRCFLFIRAVDATGANKRALARVYVDNGSGETLEDELKMFDSVVRLSVTGAEPAQVFGINLTAKQTMRDAFINLISGLTQPAWAVLANTTLPQYADGEVIAVSPTLNPNFVGMQATWEQALQYLENQYGLKVIPPPDVEAGEVTKLTGAVRGVQVFGRVIPAYDTRLGERVYDGLPRGLRDVIEPEFEWEPVEQA